MYYNPKCNVKAYIEKAVCDFKEYINERVTSTYLIQTIIEIIMIGTIIVGFIFEPLITEGIERWWLNEQSITWKQNEVVWW